MDYGNEIQNAQTDDESYRSGRNLIDDVLNNCAQELQFLAEVYSRRGFGRHAQEIYQAYENIRRGPANLRGDETHDSGN